MINRLLKIIGILFIIGLSIVCISKINSLYIADLSATAAMEKLHEGNLSKSVELINQAVRLNPLEAKYFINRASVYLTLASGETDENKKEYKLIALSSMQHAYELNTHNILVVKSLISLYYYLSLNKDGGKNISPSVDNEFKLLAKDFYATLFNKSPNDVGVYVLIYKFTKKLEISDINSAAKEKIMDLRPDLFTWYADLQ